MKRAFNILLNAKSFAQARRAIANRFIADWGRDGYYKSVDLIQAVQAQFPGFERSWFVGFGGRLQNIDADICARVQRKLRRAGVPCLSVHGSFIVPILNSQQLRSIMDDEFSKKRQQLRRMALNTSVNWCRYRKSMKLLEKYQNRLTICSSLLILSPPVRVPAHALSAFRPTILNLFDTC